MPIHLQDFMGQHPYLLWLSLVPLCWAAEALVPRRVFAMWAPAGVVGAAVAAFTPGLWWLQVIMAAAAGVLLHIVLRPRLLASDAA